MALRKSFLHARGAVSGYLCLGLLLGGCLHETAAVRKGRPLGEAPSPAVSTVQQRLVLRGRGAARAFAHGPPQPAWPQAEWLEAERQQGFQARPPKEQWEAQLAKSVEAGRRDPCSAAVLVTAGAYGNGFGARMQNFANDVWLAAYNDHTSIAICTETPFLSQVWAQLFDNPRNFGVCSSGCENQYPGLTGSWEHAGHAAQELGLIDQDYMASLKRFVFPSFFALRASTSEHVAQAFATTGLDAAAAYIGVHIRHGDKGSEARLLPVAQYAAKVRPLLKEHGLSTVYLSSDDEQALGQLQQALGEGVKVVQQKPSAGNQYGWRTGALDDDAARASELTLLADLEALKKATVFVGTASSTFGRLVYYLRGADEPSVSLDEAWNMRGA